tara:strand:- start:4 stop:693 length:690 start_codon:yes stop_codon:yes gene_type:complete
MKAPFILTLVCTLFISSFAAAQSSCNPYFTLTEGKSWTTATYNAKDKYQGKQSYEVISVEGSGSNLSAIVKFTGYDKKDKENFVDSLEFFCKDGVVSMDLSKYMPAEQLAAFETMEVKIEIDEMTVPQSLEVGQKLSDAGTRIKSVGSIPFSFEIKIKDRIVESKESIEVPAGKFEAFKITSVIEIIGIMGRETKSVEYVAPEVGAIRNESYNRKGELSTYSVLVSYSK